jgi:hypothetical protein
MRTNARMRTLLDGRFRPADSAAPPRDARAVLAGGWTLGPHGALLLADRWTGAAGPVLPNQIGSYEYDINDVYLSLDDLRGGDDLLPRAAARTIDVARRLLRAGLRLPGSGTLTAVAAVHVDADDELFDLQGGRVRLFTRRGQHPSWFDDLETFEKEALAVLDRSDVSD